MARETPELASAVTGEAFTFELRGMPPSGNARFGHWGARASSDKRWQRDAGYAAVQAARKAGLGGFPWERVTVSYRFTFPDARARDEDNLFAASKPILDGVRMIGLLVNDDRRHVHLLPITYGLGKARPTLIEVTITHEPDPEKQIGAGL